MPLRRINYRELHANMSSVWWTIKLKVRKRATKIQLKDGLSDEKTLEIAFRFEAMDKARASIKRLDQNYSQVLVRPIAPAAVAAAAAVPAIEEAPAALVKPARILNTAVVTSPKTNIQSGPIRFALIAIGGQQAPSLSVEDCDAIRDAIAKQMRKYAEIKLNYNLLLLGMTRRYGVIMAVAANKESLEWLTTCRDVIAEEAKVQFQVVVGDQIPHAAEVSAYFKEGAKIPDLHILQYIHGQNQGSRINSLRWKILKRIPHGFDCRVVFGIDGDSADALKACSMKVYFMFGHVTFQFDSVGGEVKQEVVEIGG